MGSRAVVVSAGTTDVQGLLGKCELVGIQVFETAGAAATVAIHDGTSASGPKRMNFSLAANGIEKQWPPAIPFGTGIWVERLTGTTELVLYLA